MTHDPRRPASPLPRRGAFGPSPLRGLVCGVAAALVGTAVWLGLVVATDRQVSFVAVALGLFVGHALVWGTGRGGVASAVTAVVIAGCAVLVAYYWIDRHLIIVGGEALGISYVVPRFPSPRQFAIVLRLGFRVEKVQFVFAALCVGAAAFFGFGRRPAEAALVSAPDGTAGG